MNGDSSPCDHRWRRNVQHAWAGAWMNSMFRNERPDLYLSSDLIGLAVAHTRAVWPGVPELGIVSFVDATKTRRKRDPGRCYRRAGWRHVGFTESDHLYAFQQLPDEMPPPCARTRLADVTVRFGGIVTGKPATDAGLSGDDLRATIESDVLGVVSAHGGEQIIAGPPMYRLVQELTDLVLEWRSR